jgi:uncharacterized protein involved in exopolysaccharide biosynthesis
METTEKQSGNNYLNDRQNYNLVTWLKNNQISLQEHEATGLRAAEMASHDLGFLVTEGNIRGKLVQFPECRWKKSRAQTKETKLAERIEILEKNLQNVSSTLNTLHDLYRKLETRNGNGRLFEVTR